MKAKSKNASYLAGRKAERASMLAYLETLVRGDPKASLAGSLALIKAEKPADLNERG